MGVDRRDVYNNVIMSVNNNDCKTPFARFPSNIISIALVYNTICTRGIRRVLAVLKTSKKNSY